MLKLLKVKIVKIVFLEGGSTIRGSTIAAKGHILSYPTLKHPKCSSFLTTDFLLRSDEKMFIILISLKLYLFSFN